MAETSEISEAYNFMEAGSKYSPDTLIILDNFRHLNDYLFGRISELLLDQRDFSNQRNLRSQRSDRLNSAAIALENLLMGETANLVNFYLDGGFRALQNLKSNTQEQVSHLVTKRGPVKLDGVIAVALYSVMVDAKKDLEKQLAIKRLIEPGGVLNIRVDKNFGEGVYSTIKIPTISSNGRWQKSFMETLKRRAWDHIYRNPFWNKTPEQAKIDRFSKVLRDFRYEYPIGNCENTYVGPIYPFDARKYLTI